jgi:hypothetical protein
MLLHVVLWVMLMSIISTQVMVSNRASSEAVSDPGTQASVLWNN